MFRGLGDPLPLKGSVFVGVLINWFSITKEYARPIYGVIYGVLCVVIVRTRPRREGLYAGFP